MIRYVYIITLFLTVYLFCGCTPYNADKVNTSLIQGKWILTDVDRVIYDSINVDYNKERTYLIFEGDKCAQHMSDWKDTLTFRFTIHNYELNLYKDDAPFRSLDIDALSQDSLVLSAGENKWVYKKAEQ
ncbi:hypothetical protein [uncultured Dysgonomonas sp.]|uniref:Lipocalin-like domain-containing protein n=1 Tax=uncultured Dysgonomonas sp. TaxID=206096 RepID=A0A212J388_9BACT|nr:hypothetical protein [uncultured Dysgonomonas sp.]SBV93932.1 conserved exported hypothetical protein [uncultured Dysgonomonas sp.]